MEQSFKPLSGDAYNKIDSARENYWTVPNLAIWGVGILFAVLLIYSPSWWLLINGLIIILIIYSMGRLFMSKNKALKKTIMSTMEMNALDYDKAQEIEEVLYRCWDAFKLIRHNIPVIEAEIPGDWIPFKVESYASSTTKENIKGNMTLNGGSFRGASKGTLDGNSTGESIPNLLDTASVIFLRNPEGNSTLRVILPTPTIAKELLLDAMRSLITNKTTPHVKSALKLFGKNRLRSFIMPPNTDMINQLSAFCDIPAQKRPFIKVRGQSIEEGIVLATAIEINGKQKTFVPSAFIHQLKTEVTKLI